MGVAGITINAAMLAALVGIERKTHADVFTFYFIEYRFGIYFNVLGGQLQALLPFFSRNRRTIVHEFVVRIGRIDLGSAAFEVGRFWHVVNLKAG